MARELFISCQHLKEVKEEAFIDSVECYHAIDNFTNDLNKRLKNLDGGRAMVSATTLDNSDGRVIHQTLELSPNGKETAIGFDVEIITVDAVPVQGQGGKLYNWLAEHAALWTEGGDELSEEREVPEGDEINVGVGSINNTMYLHKVLNG